MLDPNIPEDVAAEIPVAVEGKPEVGDDARREAAAIAGKDYDRDESKKEHLHRVTLIALWTVVLGGLAIASTWLFHMITPDSWHYLSPERQDMLGKMFFSGITSIFGADFVRKWRGSI